MVLLYLYVFDIFSRVLAGASSAGSASQFKELFIDAMAH
jgi:hypothetical protein